MLKIGGRSIISTVSVAALAAGYRRHVYSAAKAAVAKLYPLGSARGCQAQDYSTVSASGGTRSRFSNVIRSKIVQSSTNLFHRVIISTRYCRADSRYCRHSPTATLEGFRTLGDRRVSLELVKSLKIRVHARVPPPEAVPPCERVPTWLGSKLRVHLDLHDLHRTGFE
jgi:hypothetical protein